MYREKRVQKKKSDKCAQNHIHTYAYTSYVCWARSHTNGQLFPHSLLLFTLIPLQVIWLMKIKEEWIERARAREKDQFVQFSSLSALILWNNKLGSCAVYFTVRRIASFRNLKQTPHIHIRTHRHRHVLIYQKAIAPIAYSFNFQAIRTNKRLKPR